MRTTLAAVAATLLLAGCTSPDPGFETVDDLYEAAGGQDWCDGELNVTLAPFVGNCGDPTTDGRVVLGVGEGGGELRASIQAARGNLTDDGQLLLVPQDPDGASGWQLRSRDRTLLTDAQGRIGGVLLEDEDAVDAWLDS